MGISELVDRFCSGRHHRVVVGINLLTLHYTPPDGGSGFPINFRVVNKVAGKTKHEYLREMMIESLLWGLAPAWFTADSFYASLDNLKFLKHREIGFMIGLEPNRLTSTIPHCYERVGEAEIPEDGLFTHFKGFDFVKVYRTLADDSQARHYVVYRNDPEERQAVDRETFRYLRQVHWNIEKSNRLATWANSLSETPRRSLHTYFVHLGHSKDWYFSWRIKLSKTSMKYITGYLEKLKNSSFLTLRNSYSISFGAFCLLV